ncbi:hypothetical protein CEUSTIGMA_g10826.t1 [Chlamydomonas eustigma]|uniref:polyribonucleotide nucleotidyltransferase n=1 Tax=Chlamydomonas eustigma TaxID=1157962 RepID=A0A250XJY6_9CHLO|nr:hypothetical protein CEUSTIGMA_g10826.t1 [Chlamydomonas eustigma]|eukprot:GAX83401.1 hypothetical protein CEUSTIGMA_g10826.t1 [Chlamydomonas eustigma]
MVASRAERGGLRMLKHNDGTRISKHKNALCFAPLVVTSHRSIAFSTKPCNLSTLKSELFVVKRRCSSQLKAAPESTSTSWTYQPLEVQSVILKAGNREIVLQTGEIGRQANGSVIATCGETMVHATACCGPNATGDGEFVPFTVNYQERFSAAGRTSSGYNKRDGRPRDNETLTSRLVDRPLRPMFTKGWTFETQVLETVLSYDGLNDPEPLAITAAAAALLISDIPFEKAVAGVRVAYIATDDRFIINPVSKDMVRSSLDLVVAGTRDAILMIEGFCDFLTEEQMLQAVGLGHSAIKKMCAQMEAWARIVGKPKLNHKLLTPAKGLEARVKELVGKPLKEVYMTSSTKEERSAVESQSEATAQNMLCSAADASNVSSLQISAAVKAVKSEIMREVVLEAGRRMDGRTLTDIRPITSRCNVLPRTHGSALFTRGETQALCVATLGPKSDAQRSENIRDETVTATDRFYLQYFFPPSSVGEVGKIGGAGRRELGHGALAQRALAPVIPPDSTFPYIMRVESNITESNGSSSMASVCGGCLALLDAGVPISRPVAGIAMGLILEPDGRFSILSDILGSEDALGDMDFKVAGDAEKITAFQMDIKVEGITLDIMRKALAQAGNGRRHILAQMGKSNPAPRKALSQYAPKVLRMKIDPTKKGLVIGPGGRIINQIKEVSKVSDVTMDEEGNVEVTSTILENAQKAADFIQLVVEDPPIGKVFRRCKVLSVQMFGAFVELGPGREGLVHISQLDIVPVQETTTVASPGGYMDVMVIDSGNGKISLSRKAVLLHDSGQSVESILKSGGAKSLPQVGRRM